MVPSASVIADVAFFQFLHRVLDLLRTFNLNGKCLSDVYLYIIAVDILQLKLSLCGGN